ncbi:hypothetical protein PoB_007038900 [Plakobranchus ocellatus]|uniref:Uncharacterized protein n=1 Tax=Plakobranchus ocellatus TaxID=259542 RepID=A0AAV4DI84_9GAST|nr:hypothetical protein PoB_007038900 [Plakobranchus ocellatus]
MATIDNEQSSKHDDFFDDAPAKPLMNGHVSPEKEPTEDTTTVTNGSPDADHDDAAASQTNEAETEVSTEPEKHEDGAEEPEVTEVEEKNVGVDTAQDNMAVDSQPEEGNDATASEVAVAEEEPEAVQTTEADPPPEQQTMETEQAEVLDTQTTEETKVEPDDQNEVTSALEVGVHGETEPVPPVSRQSEYDEDFSDSSNSARETPAEVKQEDKVEAEENVLNKSSDSSSKGTPVPPAQEEAHPPEAAPAQDVTADTEGGERVDSRAEAAQVIPVPPPDTATKPADADGRSSSAGADEQGEGDAYRGEDRTEMIAPEGSEDCRGQGQWKSAEQQAITTAMLASKSERELTEEAVKERDSLRQDHEALKTQILALEAEMDKKNEQILVDKEILARKDKEISDLQKELDLSNSAVASNEAEESRIKDLQERLAVLARENEEKDKRVFRLEEELKDTQTRLRETERRLLQAESRAGAEPPKSKTCIIM